MHQITTKSKCEQEKQNPKKQKSHQPNRKQSYSYCIKIVPSQNVSKKTKKKKKKNNALPQSGGFITRTKTRSNMVAGSCTSTAWSQQCVSWAGYSPAYTFWDFRYMERAQEMPSLSTSLTNQMLSSFCFKKIILFSLIFIKSIATQSLRVGNGLSRSDPIFLGSWTWQARLDQQLANGQTVHIGIKREKSYHWKSFL